MRQQSLRITAGLLLSGTPSVGRSVVAYTGRDSRLVLGRFTPHLSGVTHSFGPSTSLSPRGSGSSLRALYLGSLTDSRG